MSWLLERLRKIQDDRGMMADLRCILVDSKKHRAWPALSRLGVAIDNDTAAFVAGLFATHPQTTIHGNFGATCKTIEENRGDRRGDDSKLTPTERRFQQLLSSERGDELNGRVLRMVLLAKSQAVPVNYDKLEKDLKYWSDRAKIEWAAAFWAPGAAAEIQEAS